MYKMLLELDEDDYRAIQEAIARRQIWRVMADGDGNVAGKMLASICRGWIDNQDLKKKKKRKP